VLKRIRRSSYKPWLLERFGKEVRMGDELSRRINAVAKRSNEAQQQAEHTYAKALEARRVVLAELFDAANEIERRQGATLGGHAFRFAGPDAKPIYDADIAVFVARVFEASFEGCPGNSTFGLNLEIDHYLQITLCYLGAAALVDTRDLVGQFVAWLDEFWLCFPIDAVTAPVSESEPIDLFADR
jgi:hypothetical protein